MSDHDSYTRSAEVYDLIYEQMKDYAAEAQRIHELIQEHRRSGGDALLDVACGSGLHLQHLQHWYRCAGLDSSIAMLQVARERLGEHQMVPHEYGILLTNRPEAFKVPDFDVSLYLDDMRTFESPDLYDAITCLFSAIGAMTTIEDLNRSIANMAAHLAPGGVLIVEPWIHPETWDPARELSLETVDTPEVKVTRITMSRKEGQLATLSMRHVVARLGDEASETFEERHELGLFTHEEYLAAFQGAGLEVTHDPIGLVNKRGQGRGLYIGVRSLTP